MHPSDDELIARYRAGDGAALEALIGRYTRPLYGFAYRMTGRREESEDIVQEAFVKAWRKLSRYRTENTFRSWIFTIARNTVIDHLRKKRMPVVSDFDTAEGKNVLVETAPDLDTLPEALIEKAEREKTVERALASLPPEDREILLLHYDQELTFDQIGKVLGKPLNTVKSRHRRALGKLAKRFETL